MSDLTVQIQSGSLLPLVVSLATLILGYLLWHGRVRWLAWCAGLPLLLLGFVATLATGWFSASYLMEQKKLPPFMPAAVADNVAVQAPPRAWLDHIVVGIYDLDVGIAELESLTGHRAIRSGRHPKLGTHTALLRIGDESFLELIAPDPNAAVDDKNRDLVEGYRELLSQHRQLTPFLWSIGSNDLRWLRRTITDIGFEMTPAIDNTRQLPSGEPLHYLGGSVAVGRPGFPFFVEWKGDSVVDLSPDESGCKLHTWRVWTPNDVALQRLAETLGVAVEAGEAINSALRAILRCNGETVVLGSTPR